MGGSRVNGTSRPCGQPSSSRRGATPSPKRRGASDALRLTPAIAGLAGTACAAHRSRCLRSRPRAPPGGSRRRVHIAEGLRGGRTNRSVSWNIGFPPCFATLTPRSRETLARKHHRPGRLFMVEMNERALSTSCRLVRRLPGPCRPACLPGFLSWGCPKIAPPSFKSGSPLRVGHCCPTVGARLPHRARVPPSWFCTTSAVYSSSTLRACCIPLPILGFTAFPPVAKRASSHCDSCPAKPCSPPVARSASPLRLACASRRVHRVPIPSWPFALRLRRDGCPPRLRR
jgi:hypothetical protein